MDLEHRTSLRYCLELFGATLLVAGTMYLRHLLAPAGSASAWRAVVGLIPIIPVWLMLVVSLRFYRSIDEYQRLVFLKLIGLSTGVLFCIHLSYPFAQSVFALPPSPDILGWPFAAVLVAIAVWFSRHRPAVETA